MQDQLNHETPQPTVEWVERAARRVAVYRLAHADTGRTVMLCHAAPGSGNFDPDPGQTAARRVTLLSVDRPGYGQSEPLPPAEWPSLAAAADDLAAVIERVARGPVGVAGWSAGGRVALALAARRPDLVERLVLLGTPAPNDQVAWIPPEQQAALDQLRGLAPDAARAALKQQLTPMLPANPRSDDALQLLAAGPADDAALALPGVRDRLAAMLAAAFAQGATGMADDIASYSLQPWGFAPEDVQAKTLLLYGSADPVAGPRHGTWWQKRLPNARLEVVPGTGHMLIVTIWHRALAHLAPNARRSA